MAGICGWLDTRCQYSNEEQLSITAAMRDALAKLAPPAPPQQAVNNDSASGMLHAGNGESATIDGLLISYSGRPWWNDAKLEQIATTEGNLKAIAQAWQRYGEDLPAHMHGAFAVTVIDTAANKAFAAIDRIGVMPMAYWNNQATLVFGANTTAVTAHPAVPKEIAPQSVFDYLYFHMVPSPRTIYQDINKLLPGQYLLFDNGTLNTDFYWRLKYDDHAKSEQPLLEKEFHGLLRDAMRRSIGDGNVGAFLSGGTDSSTMAGILTEVQGHPAKTYSIGFKAEGFDETEFARISAKHFGTDHTELYITPEDVVDAIPKIAASYDEPFGNASAVPTYLCAQLAKKDGIDILIAGDGGDEIFAGNERYLKQGVFEHYQRIPAPLRSVLIEPLTHLMPNAIMPLRKIKSYVDQAKVPLPDRLESYNFLHREALTNIFTDEFLASIDSDDPLKISRAAYHRADAGSILNKMMHLDMKNTLADNDLRKVNRMCQLGGIEARYPLLDEVLVEFSGRVPVDLKIKGQNLRYFFKHALKDFLAPDTLNKSKHGFGLPFGLWMQEYAPLRELANDSLQSFSQRGFVRSSYIDDLRNKHNSEHASYYGVMIWVIMMLEQWLQSHDAP